jgi:hypothetical protein
MAEFPDLLINPNPNAPTLDASGNQVRGINIFETTAERDALNITVRIPGASIRPLLLTTRLGKTLPTGLV